MEEDSGHSYNKETYNKDLVTIEFSSCVNLYDREKWRVEHYPGELSILENLGGWSTLAWGVGTLNPIFLTLGGGVVGYHYVNMLSQRALSNNLRDGKYLFGHFFKCYKSLQAGGRCENFLLSSQFGNMLSRKANRKINKFLDHMSAEELTMKVADYLATNRTCSDSDQKIRKMTFDKILKETAKTL